jgi:hypothetical protein
MMTDPEYRQKLDELDRLLNDPETQLDASRAWSLLSEIASHTANFCNEAAQPCKG